MACRPSSWSRRFPRAECAPELRVAGGMMGPADSSRTHHALGTFKGSVGRAAETPDDAAGCEVEARRTLQRLGDHAFDHRAAEARAPRLGDGRPAFLQPGHPEDGLTGLLLDRPFDADRAVAGQCAMLDRVGRKLMQ